MHLTNYSVNKRAKLVTPGPDGGQPAAGGDVKWTFAMLRRHFEEDLNIPWAAVWRQVRRMRTHLTRLWLC